MSCGCSLQVVVLVFVDFSGWYYWSLVVGGDILWVALGEQTLLGVTASRIASPVHVAFARLMA